LDGATLHPGFGPSCEPLRHPIARRPMIFGRNTPTGLAGHVELPETEFDGAAASRPLPRDERVKWKLRSRHAGPWLAEDRQELWERAEPEVGLGEILVARRGTRNRRAGHPGGLRGEESVARVLDDQARAGRQAEAAGGLDEDVRRRLTAAQVGAGDERLEERDQAERLHGDADDAERRRRGHRE